MGDYDISLKTMFDHDGREIIMYLFGEDVVRPAPTNLLLRTPRFADALYHTSDGEMLHLEFQSTNDPTMGWRMNNYRSAITFHENGWKHPIPLRQIVIYFGRRPLNMPRLLVERNIFSGFEVYDIRQLIGDRYQLTDPFSFNMRLMILLGQRQARLSDWRLFIRDACVFQDETQRLEWLCRLEMLSGLYGAEFRDSIVGEIAQMALELNVEHTEFTRRLMDLGARQNLIKRLSRHLERASTDNAVDPNDYLQPLSFDQLELLYDLIEQGNEFWESYDQAIQRQNYTGLDPNAV